MNADNMGFKPNHQTEPQTDKQPHPLKKYGYIDFPKVPVDEQPKMTRDDLAGYYAFSARLARLIMLAYEHPVSQILGPDLLIAKAMEDFVRNAHTEGLSFTLGRHDRADLNSVMIEALKLRRDAENINDPRLDAAIAGGGNE
jgi:hypothetical protein